MQWTISQKELAITFQSRLINSRISISEAERNKNKEITQIGKTSAATEDIFRKSSTTNHQITALSQDAHDATRISWSMKDFNIAPNVMKITASNAPSQESISRDHHSIRIWGVNNIDSLIGIDILFWTRVGKPEIGVFRYKN